MRIPLLLCLSLLGACRSSTPSASTRTEEARRLAQRFLITDGHVDLPYRLHEEQQAGRPLDDVGGRTGGDFDLVRAREGGLDAPFLSIFTPASLEAEGGSRRTADELIDLVEAIVSAHPDLCTLATTADQVRAAFAARKTAFLLGMENGSPLEGRLANLEHFARRGVRYITLCHGEDNHLCDSSYDTRHTHSGLTDFGRQVVRRMNELGVLVDVSHISDDSFWQVLQLTRAPVIASHSSLRWFVPGFERNMSDEMVRAMKANGGVIQINFGSTFLTAAANRHGSQRRAALAAHAAENELEPDSAEQREFAERWDAGHPFPYATVRDVADHIDRVRRLAGIDHVGFGSDFDGVGDTLPIGLKDVSTYPNLIAELLRRGYSESDIEKVCGGNVLRVLAEAERASQELNRRP